MNQHNEIDQFKQLSQINDPTGTELTLNIHNGTNVTVTIKQHYDAYDDPLEQKYKVTANGQTSYIFVDGVKVKIAKEDADNLPLGPTKTVTQITQN